MSDVTCRCGRVRLTPDRALIAQCAHCGEMLDNLREAGFVPGDASWLSLSPPPESAPKQDS